MSALRFLKGFDIVAGEGLGGDIQRGIVTAGIGAGLVVDGVSRRVVQAYEDRSEFVDRATQSLEHGRSIVEGAQGFVDDTIAPLVEAVAPILDHPLVGGGLEIAGEAVVAAVDARREGRPLRGKVARAVGARMVRTALHNFVNDEELVERQES